jgi:DNA-binding beta-propeller fold protein YncE
MLNLSGSKLVAVSLMAVTMIVAGGCAPHLHKTPAMLVELPDYCNTPDGATLAPDGDIILSVPNFNNNLLPKDKQAPAVMMKISPDNKISVFYKYTKALHPETKKVGPMGLDFGPDGNLYVADNQLFNDPEHKSRLLRINMKNGKPVSCDVVVEGFIVSNAVIWRGDTVYVSETFLDSKPRPMPSGIYAFKISEFKGKPVKLKPWTKDNHDPHLIATFYTSGKIGFGADGLTFDPQGNLYCGIFEDGVVYKMTFDKSGKVTSNKPWAKAPHMKCCDGIFYNAPDNKIYVADMTINAVQAVDMDASITTVSSNGNTDGRNGLIDQPCEVIVRGNDLIIVNMDMPFKGIVNTKFDKPWSLSVIKLDYTADKK